MKMKTFSLLSLFALCAVLLILPFTVHADGSEIASGTCGENLTWVLDDTNTLTISGIGTMYDFDDEDGYAPWYDRANNIELVVVGEGVTTVGAYAFNRVEAYTISLPESLISIGSRAFSYCQSLCEIDIPSSVTSIAEDAFYGCLNIQGIWTDVRNPLYSSDDYGVLFNRDKSVLIAAPSLYGVDYIIPESVTRIRDYAFSYCCSESIIIGYKVTILGERAFSDCCTSKLVFLGDAPAISTSAFKHVTAEVYYPEGNETWTDAVRQNYGGDLVWSAYPGCEYGHHYGEVYNISQSTCIKEGSFSRNCVRCGYCDTVVIPVTDHNYISVVTAPSCGTKGCTTHRCTVCDHSYVDGYTGYVAHTFEDGLCSGCGMKEGVIIDSGSCGENVYWTLDDNGTLVISGEGKITRGFWWDDRINMVHIEEGVTSICDEAFENLDNLTSIVLPVSMAYIGERAFWECDNLWHVLYRGTEEQYYDITIVIWEDKYWDDWGLFKVMPCGGYLSDDYLFAACWHYECTGNEIHYLMEEETCTKDGGLTHYCTICDEERIADSIDAKGHEYICEVVIEPGCETPGLCRYICTICGYSYDDEIAPEHAYLCDEIGEPSCTEHGVSAYTCTMCGDTLLETIAPYGHTLIDRQCIRCDFVGDKIENMLDSQYALSDLHVDESGTYSTPDGSLVYIALNNENDGGIIEWLGGNTLYQYVSDYGDAYFDLTHWDDLVLLMDESGYVVLTDVSLSYLISVTTGNPNWGETEEQIVYYLFYDRAGEIPCEHTYTPKVTIEPNCTEPGICTYICSACGDSYTEEIAATGHEYSSVVTAPTCTENGYTTHTCAICGATYTSDTVEATGHRYEVTVVEATCTAAGSTTYTCHCGDTYTEEIPALGHSFVGGACERCGALEVMPGDANGDGKVNARDARLILRYAASLITDDEIDQAAADFNGDGKINARDARALLRAAAGLN